MALDVVALLDQTLSDLLVSFLLLVVLGVVIVDSILASQALLIILLEVGLVGDLPGCDFPRLFSILVLVVLVGIKEFMLLHGGIGLV